MLGWGSEGAYCGGLHVSVHAIAPSHNDYPVLLNTVERVNQGGCVWLPLLEGVAGWGESYHPRESFLSLSHSCGVCGSSSMSTSHVRDFTALRGDVSYYDVKGPSFMSSVVILSLSSSLSTLLCKAHS